MVRDIHTVVAWVVIIGNGLAGAWALAAHRYEQLRYRALWIFTGVAEVAISVQVTLGAIMIAAQGFEVSQFHMFYGFLSFVAVGLLFSYRHQLAEHIYLLYGGGGLFVMGLGIRSFTLVG